MKGWAEQIELTRGSKYANKYSYNWFNFFDFWVNKVNGSKL